MKIKSMLALLLALALLCGAALAEGAGDPYVGKWISGRIVMTIEAQGDGYAVSVDWGGSAWELAHWEYADVTYDAVADELNTPETGVKSYLTYGDDGELASSEEVYSDGAAAFRLNADGTLTWVDYKETPGENEILLEQAQPLAEAPAPEAFADLYFRAIGGVEQGTAGASLKLAAAAADAFSFAYKYRLCDADDDALRENLLAGFESLTDAEREAFDANFMDMVLLLDACMEDWDANRALFDDAGKADLMDAAMADPDGPLSWQSLRNHTLTMGNSDN